MVLPRFVAAAFSVALLASALTVAPVVGDDPIAPATATQPALLPADPPPPAYDDVVLADAPSMYYRLNETSGPFEDSSGRGIPGLALTGGSPWTAGQAGALTNQPTDGAAKFSGTNGSSQTSVNAGLPTGNAARSVEWWSKSAGGGEYKIGWGGFEIIVWGTGFTVGANTFRLPVGTMTNRWHHYVISYDPTQSRLIQVFVDGKLAGSGSAGSNYSTTNTTFRIWARTIATNPNARLDEIAVYPSALTQVQAAQHFAASGATRPNGVGGLSATGGSGEVTASWSTAASSDTPDSEPGVVGYRVSAIDGFGTQVSSKWVGPAATSATITGLGAGDFTAKVEATNGFFGLGDAQTSDEVTTTDGGAYGLIVRGDGPKAYYRFGEDASAPWLADSSGLETPGADFDPALLPANSDGALTTDPDTARTFASRNTTYTTPGTMTALPNGNSARSTELWIRNNYRGGQIGFGWGGYDMHIADAGSISGPGFNLSMSQSVMDGEWHHLAITYEPSIRRYRFYVDANLIRTHDGASDLTTGTGPLAILGTNSRSYPNAKLDEFAVYDSTLSQAQIVEHFAASGRSRPPAPTSVDATASPGQLAVTWLAVDAPPGQPTTGYKVNVLSGATVIQTKWAPASATDVTLSGLAAGDYTVSVQASNANGLGEVGTTPQRTVPAGDTAYASTVRSENPALYYRLGEAAGSRAYADSSGRDITGSDMLLNGKLVPNQAGGIRADGDKAAALAGWEPVIENAATSAGLPNGNAARTLEWWMRGTAGPAVLSYGGFDVTANNGSVKFGATTVATTRRLLDGDWHHVAVTYAPASSRLITVYVDGQQHATANAAANVTGTDGRFSIRGGTLSDDSNVRLDEVAVYSGTLSAAQVEQHFEAAGAARR